MKINLLAAIVIMTLGVGNKGMAQQTFDCKVATAYDFLDVNSVRARVNQGGTMWWD